MRRIEIISDDPQDDDVLRVSLEDLIPGKEFDTLGSNIRTCGELSGKAIFLGFVSDGYIDEVVVDPAGARCLVRRRRA